MTWLTTTLDIFSEIISWIRFLSFYAAVLVIGPWILALVADLLLYFFRSITYEIPVLGGRARGRAPPEPPSISEAKGLPATGKVEQVVGGVVAATGGRGDADGEGVRRRVGGQQEDGGNG